MLQALHVETAHKLKGRRPWTRIPHPRAPARPAGATRPLSVGFYVSWDESSRASLAEHIDQLDVVSPQWIVPERLAGAGRPSPPTRRPRRSSPAPRTPPSVLPDRIINAHDGVCERAAGRQPAAQPRGPHGADRQPGRPGQEARLRRLCLRLREPLAGGAGAAYPGFIAQARAALKPLGREVWVTAPFADDDWPLKALQAAADTVVLMAYDEHWGGPAQPGPAGRPGLVREEPRPRRMAQLDPAKTVVALGAYGYDWTLRQERQGDRRRDRCSSTTRPRRPTTPRPTVEHRRRRAQPDLRLPGRRRPQARRSGSWTRATLFNQIKVADAFRPRGYALWRMGGEDPAVWQLLPPALRHRPSRRAWRPSQPGTDVDFDGKGEVLHVDRDARRPASARIEIDPDTGLISGEDYEVMPTSYVIQRYGCASRAGWR